MQMLYFVIKLCSKTDITPADLKLGHVTVMRLLIAKLLSIANCSTGEWNKALAGVLYQCDEKVLATVARCSVTCGQPCKTHANFVIMDGE